LSPLQQRQREKALTLLREESILKAEYRFNRVTVQRVDGDYLLIDGVKIEAPLLIPEQGELTELCCGVCTLGARLEQRITELFAEKRPSLGLALDSVGNELLFALGRRLQDRIVAACRKEGLSVGQDLHAGDPGLDISAQTTILRLAQAESIGIHLHHSNLLKPLKSTSVVFSVGHDLPEATWSRCDNCPSRKRCKLTSNTTLELTA
jgi:hypothetical protein